MRIYSWNPRRTRLAGFGHRYQLAIGPRVNNFGDLLGPLIVQRIKEREGLTGRGGRGTLFSVGSVLHFARSGDHVWGSGRNGKVPDVFHRFSQLSVHAVRGPRTAAFLRELGLKPPAVYGDPALLLPTLFPETVPAVRGSEGVFVPNLRDARSRRPGDLRVIDPQRPVWEVVAEIARAAFVVSSSLHGVIVAETYGVPARLVVPEEEPMFKYLDYYEGTERFGVRAARSVEEALTLGAAPDLAWAPAPLLTAFPASLWSSGRSLVRA